jgi:hypothetical protein
MAEHASFTHDHIVGTSPLIQINSFVIGLCRTPQSCEGVGSLCLSAHTLLSFFIPNLPLAMPEQADREIPGGDSSDGLWRSPACNGPLAPSLVLVNLLDESWLVSKVIIINHYNVTFKHPGMEFLQTVHVVCCLSMQHALLSKAIVTLSSSL